MVSWGCSPLRVTDYPSAEVWPDLGRGGGLTLPSYRRIRRFATRHFLWEVVGQAGGGDDPQQREAREGEEGDLERLQARIGIDPHRLGHLLRRGRGLLLQHLLQ